MFDVKGMKQLDKVTYVSFWWSARNALILHAVKDLSPFYLLSTLDGKKADLKDIFVDYTAP